MESYMIFNKRLRSYYRRSGWRPIILSLSFLKTVDDFLQNSQRSFNCTHTKRAMKNNSFKFLQIQIRFTISKQSIFYNVHPWKFWIIKLICEFIRMSIWNLTLEMIQKRNKMSYKRFQGRYLSEDDLAIL